MFYLYMIYSEVCDEFYKGITENPVQRLFEHNNALSRHTAGKGPWKLVYLKQFNTKKEALIQEKRIKKLNRRSVLKLIESQDSCLSSRQVGLDEMGSNSLPVASGLKCQI